MGPLILPSSGLVYLDTSAVGCKPAHSTLQKELLTES